MLFFSKYLGPAKKLNDFLHDTKKVFMKISYITTLKNVILEERV